MHHRQSIKCAIKTVPQAVGWVVSRFGKELRLGVVDRVPHLAKDDHVAGRHQVDAKGSRLSADQQHLPDTGTPIKSEVQQMRCVQLQVLCIPA